METQLSFDAPGELPRHRASRATRVAGGFSQADDRTASTKRGTDQWFFALQPTDAAREAAIRYQQEISTLHGLRGFRLKPENLHVSLHSIGGGPVLPEGILKAARDAAASLSLAPFGVTFDEAMSFKSSGDRKPFVLCGGKGATELVAFHRLLGEAMRQHGLGGLVRRSLTPHMTLIWDPAPIAPHSVPPISWIVTEYVLVHSIAGKNRHRVVARWPLGCPATAVVRFISTPRATCPDNPVRYAELHARSAFSFLRGGSIPEDLVCAAKDMGVPAMALLDRDGVYGAPRFYQSAHEGKFAVRPRTGAEITMEDGSVVPLLVANRTGYQNLCQLITAAKLTERQVTPASSRPAEDCRPEAGATPRDRKRPCFATWAELERFSGGLVALTGDEEGPVRRAWRTQGAAAARAALEKLTAIFGCDSDPANSRLFVELQRHRIRGEDREISFLRDLAAARRLPLLATGGVNYATRDDCMVADVFTCLRLHLTLDAAGRHLEPNAGRRVKSAAEMRALFADLPAALDNSVRLESRLDFTLQNLGYEFPVFPTPPGVTMDQLLRERTFDSAPARIGGPVTPELAAQLNRELELIARLKFSGYFLIVWDICRWARGQNILVQGRGSAANSAVCYVLGITAVNPLKHRLLFDRFLNDSRVGRDGKPSWPDIDLDFPSGDRRERVIQQVYQRYGRRGAAMTANVICFRGRSATREIGKVLGFGADALDRFSSLYANGDFPETLGLQEQLKMSGIAAQHPRAEAMVRLNHLVRGLPRHLGQHSGGMVICQGQLDQVVPLEPATMPDRSVCQWDKEDCENLGIVKIDFLGLGMMAVMQETIELCARRPDGPRTMDDIPPDDPVTYEKIRAADTVGVFQIESRAQMSTLPRFKPKDLYDLAIQVAIIRPGPITGNLVHPLIRRRDKEEAVEYIDRSVEKIVQPILERTMGVILFQEQMLELSMALAKFNGAEAEELRRAMGFTKNHDRMGKSMVKLTAALRAQGHNETVVDKVVKATTSFAAYGFPESHAIGFAILAYGSTWLKIHRPAEFYACLLNNQPMGFYSPATLLQDAKRAGRDLQALPACVQHSGWACSVVDPKTIRLGLRYVKGVREAAVQTMLGARHERPFASMDDFLRRTVFTATERRALAAVGALNVFATDRRGALWRIEAAWSDDEALFKQFADAGPGRSPLAPMTLAERLGADFRHTGLTTGRHPMALLRPHLAGVCSAADLKSESARDKTVVTIAGSVICRQRPGTASGVVFVSLEDETGIANAVVMPPIFEANRLVITQEPALKITGRLQKVSGVIHVKAERIEPLRAAGLPAQVSYDFH